MSNFKKSFCKKSPLKIFKMVLSKKDLDECFESQNKIIQKNLDEGLEKQKTAIEKQIKDSINEIRNEVLKKLTEENSKLHTKINVLEEKIVDLEKRFEQNQQYQRNQSVVIAGIPENINHIALEGIVVNLFNKVCLHNISDRDIVACHRISTKSLFVLVKFLNKKDASALVNSRLAIGSLHNNEIGLSDSDKLYVDFQLTPYMGKLAYICRCLKRNGEIMNTKVERGSVKILFQELGGTMKWHLISHSVDIKKLVSTYNPDDYA